MQGSVVLRGGRAALSWAWDWLIEHWPTVSAALLTGGGLTYLASITEWLKPWGPAGFGIIGLTAALVTYLIFALAYSALGKGRERRAQAEFITARAQWRPVNVLAPFHNNEKIELSQFFDPFYLPVENVRFEDCVLLGPAMVALDGGTMLNSRFIECEVVIARPDRLIRGAVMFRHWTVNRCRVFRVTFVMPIQAYQSLPNEVKAGLPVISDGRIGDV